MRQFATILAGIVAIALLVDPSLAQPPRGQGQQNDDREARGQRQGQGPRREPGGRGGGQGGSRNPVLLALDADGDGELSAAEIANVEAALKTLDANGDGKLGRDELRPADRGQGQGGDLNRPPRPGESRDRENRRPDEGGSRGGGPRGGRADWPSTADLQAPPPQVPEALENLPAAPIAGFVTIPAGEFEMGDHHDLGGMEHSSDEIPIHKVRVDGFYMAATETTNRQYCAFLNEALSQGSIQVGDGVVYGTAGGSVRRPATTGAGAAENEIYFETAEADRASGVSFDGRTFRVRENREQHPVVCVRWLGAAACCNWMSSKNGYESCYDLATGRCDMSKDGFRLPTEAEWEYAGRGGLYGPYYIFPWGNEADTSRANWPNSGDPFETGPLPLTTPVGYYNGELHRKEEFNWAGTQPTYQTRNGANGYGLYDMSGNVWEWVNDWYDHHYYAASPSDNPAGPTEGQPMRDGKPYRVLRSGSWYNGLYGHSRVSNRNPSYYRGPDDPNHSYYHIGFRPVLSAGIGATALMVTSQSHATPAAVRRADHTVGLMLNSPKACPGYTLFAPKHNTTTFLMDNEGRVVNSWESEYEPGQSVYLQPNGNLLHCCFTKNKGFTRGGEGGRLEEFDWEGNLIWEFEYSSDQYLSHHDIAPMPNGNILILAVEKKSYDEAIAAGFEPRMLRDQQLFPEFVIEVEPTRPKGGRILWEWHVWDHLIQDNDRTKANYGDVATHPERIDIDCNGRPVPTFWNHANSIDYNAKLDQLVISARGCNEIWVIDHSTTTEEAASSTGGRRGKGGDLLYRWGNPAAYGCGTSRDKQLVQQHDAQWIPDGYPGAGNILIFNNGYDRGYSSVEEIVPPVDAQGNYILEPGRAFGPTKPVWRYEAENREDFFSSEISGTHRLPNGNTLICAGVLGTLFEVTPAGETVWNYVNSMVRGGILAQGEVPGLDHRGHQWNAVFKIHRYPLDYAGLPGRDLTPGKVIELPAGQTTGLSGASEEQLGKRPGGGRGDARGPGGRDNQRPRGQDRGGRGGQGRRKPPRPDDQR